MTYRFAWLMLPLAIAATPVSAKKSGKVIEPLPAALVGHVTVAATTVTIGDTAKASVDKLDAKAAQKGAAATPASGTKPDASDAGRYATLPLTAMLPLEVADVTRDWGLTTGRAVRLVVTIDAAKTANAGMAMLLASSDELAGSVVVQDAVTGERLGEIYVDVLNTSAGMLGLAVRGSGVREKLAAAFAGQIAVQLNGSKHKPKAKP